MNIYWKLVEIENKKYCLPQTPCAFNNFHKFWGNIQGVLINYYYMYAYTYFTCTWLIACRPSPLMLVFFLFVFYSSTSSSIHRCGWRLPLRFSFPWVWHLEDWLLCPVTTLCITTATGMPSWSHWSTVEHQCSPVLLFSVSLALRYVLIKLKGNYISLCMVLHCHVRNFVIRRFSSVRLF